MRSFGVDDVLVGPPSWPTVIRRGLRKQCARCGGGPIFESRYRLAKRCPDCGLKFQREPGFRLGAWFLNFMFIMILSWVAVMAWIIWRSNNAGGSILWPMLIAGAAVVVIPIFTYPWSLSMWSAVDLAMTPLELTEIVDAQDALADPTVDERTVDPPSEDADQDDPDQ